MNSEKCMDKAFDHPLLAKISDMAVKVGGTPLFAVFSGKGGWEQCCLGGAFVRPEFCRLIQSAAEGAKHCKMCHVLMSVAACSAGAAEQRCHAGISVLVTPASNDNSHEASAVLSTCIFTSPDRSAAWLEAKKRGKRLVVDMARLKQAFNAIPVLTSIQTDNIKALMAVAADAIMEIKAHILLQEELMKSREHTHVKGLVEAEVELQLKEYGKTRSITARNGKNRGMRNKAPVLVRVIDQMVRRRPDIPYNVSEIASAARMTPNHFSAIFHRHKGRTFRAFLTEERIEKAKELLGDFTLNISEVALRVGFDDAGYFARRFRQITGVSPRKWREEAA